MHNRLARLLLPLVLAAAGPSAAQTVTIGDAFVQLGATTAVVPITYTGGGNVVSYQIDLAITRGGASPIAPNGNVTTVNSDGTCSGSAISMATGTALRFTDIDLGNVPLPNGTVCTLTFPLDVGNLAIGDQIVLSASVAEFNDLNGTVAGTVTPGSITVVNAPLQGPGVIYTPAPNAAPATVTFAAATSIGGSTSTPIALAIDGATPGSSGGETTLDVSTCTTGNPIVTVQAADVICTGGASCTDGTDNDVDLTCVATNAAQTGTITCNEVRDDETIPGDGGFATTPRSWGYTCPPANVAPTITPTTASGSNVNTSTVGQGQTSTATFTFTPSAGSGTGSSTVTGCTIAAPFSIVPANPTLTFTGTSTTPQSFNVTCTAGAAAQGPQALNCTVGGAAYTVNVTCPAGLPVAAPTMTATPAEDADDTSDASAEVTFSAPLGLAGNSTSTIDLDVSGGIDDATGTAETVAITGCAISNNGAGNITITTPPAATAFGTGDPAGDVDTSIGLRCGGNAAATTALLTCTVNSVANGTTTPDTRIWDIACPAAVTAPEVSTTPASPGTINVQGQPGNVVAAQVAFTNTGDADLIVDTCVATVDDAGITFTPPASPIAINGGTAALSFSCTAPGLNTTITETVQCNTNDADEATVTFTLNCTGANLLPIPAINGLGKALMAALIIGLGLIGLGLRRQTV